MLTIMDIYNFMSSYHNSSCEHLLLWLSNFNLQDQLSFISLFTTNKINVKLTPFMENFNNSHDNCKCLKIYENFPEIFQNKCKSINFIKKCVVSNDEKKINKHHVKFNITQEFVNNSKSIKFLETKKNSPIKLKIDNENYENYISDLKKILFEFDKFNEDENFDYSLPIKIFNIYKFEFLIQYFNIIEIYTIYLIKTFFSIRDFERLLPEYWKSLTRNTYSKKINHPHSILKIIYNFYTSEQIIESNTSTKAIFKLPNLKILKCSDCVDSETHILQPKFSGIRIVLCKTNDSGLLIKNINNCKVKMNLQIGQLLSQDLENTYTGEFIIMLYDKTTYSWLPKQELVAYMGSSIKNPNYEVKLFILDLFVWNSINLLTLSYIQRTEIINKFINSIIHFNLFIKVPFIENEMILRNLHQRFLKHDDLSVKPYFSGVVFRNKNVNFEKELKSKIFKTQKYTILYKYSKKILLVNQLSPTKNIKNVSHCVLNHDNVNYKLNFVCYYASNKLIKVAVYNVYKFVPFLDITTNTNLQFLEKFMNKYIIINGTQYTWTMVTIGFQTLYDNIQFIHIHPDKSLLDCVTLSYIQSLEIEL